MTKSEALIKLKAKLRCWSNIISGDFVKCNLELCNDCDLCYLQGNMGEQKQALRIAIDSLEKEIDSNDL